MVELIYNLNMANNIVRLESIEINGLKNVSHGKVSLFGSKQIRDALSEKRADMLSSDIVGIFGQNGSGKTAVIDSLYFLKEMLTGKRFDSDVAEYIKFGETSLTCSFLFFIFPQNKERLAVKYSFSIGREKNEFLIKKESLKYALLENEKKLLFKVIVEYDADKNNFYNDFMTAENLALLKRGQLDDFKKLQSFLILHKDMQRSFIFFSQSNLLLLLKTFVKQDNHINKILKSLHRYGNAYLTVFRNEFSAKNMEDKEFHLSYSNDCSDEKRLVAEFMYKFTDAPVPVPEDAFDLLSKISESLNIVLPKIVPNMQLKLEDFGSDIDKNGKNVRKVLLFSYRGETCIPLKYESDGIKKLVAMLGVFIDMYNNPSVTLAIDEFDSGVFEYLLGELVKIVEETGRGQLIFTSHNLRPLELLNYKSLFFTTMDENERYVQLSAIKTNNNVRKVYYNAVQLGGQKAELYDMIDSYEIRDALRLAENIND